jgi:signal transduction histidine kinase/CheY-like chemotaxis protein
MDKISTRAFAFLEAVAQHVGVELEPLFEGLPPRDAWEQLDQFVTWNDWRVLVARLARRVDDEERLLEASAQAWKPQSFGPLASFFPDVLSCYEFLARFGGPSLYRCLHFKFERGDGGAGYFGVELMPGFQSCPAFFTMIQGSLRTVPRGVGAPDANVLELSRTERSATWLVSPRGAPWDPIKTPVPGSQALMDTLYSQQERLSHALAGLRAGDADLRNVLAAMPDLVAVHEGGSLRWVNEPFARFFGRRSELLEGVTLRALIPDGQHPRLEPLLRNEPGNVTLQVSSGGTLRTLDAVAGQPLTFGGRPASLFVARDVTAELELQRRAQRSESTLATVLDALPDLVMRFGADLTLLAMYGASSLPERPLVQSVVGLQLPDIQARWGIAGTERAKAMLEGLDEALRTQSPGERPVVSKDPEGRPRDLLLRFVPLDGEVLIISRDRTKELQGERRMKVVERMASLGELAAGVAHEINNPLTAVLGSLDALEHNLTQGGPREEAKALVGEIGEACRRIRDTASRMREFSHVQPPSRRVVRLLDVVERAGRMTRFELRYRARLEVHVDAGLEVVGDADELSEVVVHLLANAAQAMPEGASPETHRVQVRGAAQGELAVLEVIDDGVGIPPESLSRIFDPYFTTRVRRAGAGFGLAICHRVVTAHGGTIDATSEPGRTTLTLKLPRAASRPREAAPSGPTPEPRRATVLVIDDEPSVGRAIRRALAAHEVEVVGDGRAAFSRLRDGELPDLVLCDLMMPGFTGMELFAALKYARPEALERITFISGGTFTAAASAFLRDSTVRVMPKPFTDGELEALVQRVLNAG